MLRQIAGFAALVLAACAAPVTAEQSPAPPDAPPAASPSAFATALYREAAEAPGNHFLSPYSVESAFALLYPGARGQTADEIAAAFGFETDAEAAAIRVHARDRALQGAEASGLSLANAIWVERTFALAPGYERIVRERLGGVIEALDFVNQTEASRVRINAWAAAATRDRIRDLLNPGIIQPDTRLVLTNAVHFKADWADPFPASATRDGDFHAADGRTLAAELMRQTTRARYFETADFQAAEFDYEGGQFALAVFLPRAPGGIAAFDANLTAPALDAWLAQLAQAEPANLNLVLPKVTMEASYELAETMQDLGVRTAFTHAADLSGLGAAGLYVTNVVHKTFLAIDEQGTEAAAATAIVIAPTAAPIEQPRRIDFIADRPFFLALRHRESGAILFIGRVMEP